LYCIVLLLCYPHNLILETLVLTFVYFAFYCVVRFVCVLCAFFFSWQVSCPTVVWQNLWT